MAGSVKQQPELKKRVLSKLQASKPSNQLGDWGEQRAARYLQHKGFQILDTNVRLGQLELDIVAFDPQEKEVAFVEVKTRSSGAFGHPSSALDRRKMVAFKKMAIQYLALKRLSQDFRFDVITLLPGNIEHFENVTW